MQRRPSPSEEYQESWSEAQCHKWFVRPVARQGILLQVGKLRCEHYRFMLMQHPSLPLWLLWKASAITEWAHRPFLLIRRVGGKFEVYRVHCHLYSHRGLAVYQAGLSATAERYCPRIINYPYIDWEHLTCGHCEPE